MRRITTGLLILVCSLILVVPASAKASNEYVTSLPIMGKDESCNILVVGNSFARDTQEYMSKVAVAAGYKNIAVGLVQINASNLYKMWEEIELGNKSFSYRVMTDERIVKRRKEDAKTIFNEREWDIVILQPQSYSHAGGLDFFMTKASKNTARRVYLNEIMSSRPAQPVETEVGMEQPDTTDPDLQETERLPELQPGVDESVSEPEAEESDSEESETEESVMAEESQEPESAAAMSEMDEALLAEAESEEETAAEESSPAAEESPVESAEEEEEGAETAEAAGKVCILDIWADYIHLHNKNTKIGLELTWAYPKDSSAPEFPKFGSNQMKMYKKVSSVTRELMKKSSMDFVVPVGTAIQNARSSYIGDHMTRDRRHLSQSSGRVLSAMSAARSCGISLSGVKSIKATNKPFSTLHLPMLQSCVRDALKTPYSVTAQSKDLPKLKTPIVKVKYAKGYNTLTWDQVEGATGYALFRRKANEEYILIATLEQNQKLFTDKKIKKGSTYTYILTAKGDDNIQSKNSKSVKVICKAEKLPAEPQKKK